MNRLLAGLIGLTVWLGWASSGLAQDQANAAAIAAQQEAEERYKKLSATLDDLKEAQAEQAKRLQALEKELQRWREESTQANSRYASAEDLKQLAEKVTEVDAKRQADNEKVLSALEKLAKSVTAPRPTELATASSRPASVSPKTANAKGGYYYEVRDKDTLSGIVKAYRDQGIKVTLKQLMEANPTIKPTTLKPGDKVWVPDVAQ
jgi:multidrug efflux pump subunit AcrA (membrane-fusion protein)